MTPERIAKLRMQGHRKGSVLMHHYEANELFEAAEREAKLLGLVGEAADCLMGNNRDNVPELWGRLDKARRGEL